MNGIKEVKDFWKNPCDSCPVAERDLRDSWGGFCHVNCNERWHWVSKQIGAQEMLEHILSLAPKNQGGFMTDSANDNWIKEQEWEIKGAIIPTETHTELLNESIREYGYIWKQLSRLPR